MLSSHSWWKWSEPTITSTSGRARVRVSRNASTLRTHSSAKGGGLARRCGAGPVVEGVVGGRDHGDQLSHRGPPRRGGRGGQRGCRDVRLGVDGRLLRSTDRKMSFADRVAQLLGELADQPGGAGEQGEAAQQLQRQPEVGQRRAADAGAVERQRPAEHLRVHAADRGEQRQVRAGQAFLGGDPDQPRRARVAVLVHVVAEARDERAGRPPLRATVRSASASQPASSVGSSPSTPASTSCEEPAAVLGDAEEARAAAEQPRRQRALHRVRRGQVRQPGDDRGRA